MSDRCRTPTFREYRLQPVRPPSRDSLLGAALAERRRIAHARFGPDWVTQMATAPGLAPSKVCADLELVTDEVVTTLAVHEGGAMPRTAPPPVGQLARALSRWSGFFPSLRAPIERSVMSDRELAERWAVILAEGLEELVVNHLADAELAIRCGVREWCRPPSGDAAPGDLDPEHLHWRAPAFVGVIYGSPALACAGLLVEGCGHLEEAVASLLLSDGHLVTQPRQCTQPLLRTLFAAGWVGSDQAESLEAAG